MKVFFFALLWPLLFGEEPDISFSLAAGDDRWEVRTKAMRQNGNRPSSSRRAETSAQSSLSSLNNPDIESYSFSRIWNSPPEIHEMNDGKSEQKFVKKDLLKMANLHLPHTSSHGFDENSTLNTATVRESLPESHHMKYGSSDEEMSSTPIFKGIESPFSITQNMRISDATIEHPLLELTNQGSQYVQPTIQHVENQLYLINEIKKYLSHTSQPLSEARIYDDISVQQELEQDQSPIQLKLERDKSPIQLKLDQDQSPTSENLADNSPIRENLADHSPIREFLADFFDEGVNPSVNLSRKERFLLIFLAHFDFAGIRVNDRSVSATIRAATEIEKALITGIKVSLALQLGSNLTLLSRDIEELRRSRGNLKRLRKKTRTLELFEQFPDVLFINPPLSEELVASRNLSDSELYQNAVELKNKQLFDAFFSLYTEQQRLYMLAKLYKHFLKCQRIQMTNALLQMKNPELASYYSLSLGMNSVELFEEGTKILNELKVREKHWRKVISEMHKLFPHLLFDLDIDDMYGYLKRYAFCSCEACLRTSNFR